MKRSQPEWSRRKFISVLTGTGGVVILNPRFSWAASQPDPRVAAIVAKTIGIDTHNHIDVPISAAELPGPAIDLAGELKIILPELEKPLGQGGAGRFRLETPKP